MKGVRSRLTYANVMATVAVFIALGGASYAVSQLPKNSVKAKQIAKDAVRASEVKANAVGTSEVADGSLLEADFGAGQLPVGLTGDAGPAGATGPKGATGLSGSIGPPGPTFAATIDRADPVASPDNPGVGGATVSFTAPAAGRLLVEFEAVDDPTSAINGVSITCSAGNPAVGLYVDGVPVPNTALTLASGVFAPFTLMGVTAASISAGPHVAGMGANCPSGDFAAASIGNASNMAVVLLGG